MTFYVTPKMLGKISPNYYHKLNQYLTKGIVSIESVPIIDIVIRKTAGGFYAMYEMVVRGYEYSELKKQVESHRTTGRKTDYIKSLVTDSADNFLDILESDTIVNNLKRKEGNKSKKKGFKVTLYELYIDKSCTSSIKSKVRCRFHRDMDLDARPHNYRHHVPDYKFDKRVRRMFTAGDKDYHAVTNIKEVRKTHTLFVFIKIEKVRKDV